MKLLVDVGNTRAKWAVLEQGRLSRAGAAIHRGLRDAEWLGGLDALAGPCERILVSNVAGPAVAHALGEWALARHGLRPEFVHATRSAAGVENSYDHPETLGADRWLGMIAAWRRVHGALVCIAAGTAMTVDALDPQGRHMGGLIMPGYDMMTDSLLRRTSDIARSASLEAPLANGILGRNTAAAVELGASHALSALAERVVDWVRGESGAVPRVLIGGGDAARIEPLLNVQADVVPDLVLEGLAVIAEVNS
jgi:type III pantothenate kinase